ncbi:MAG: hypothetical protein RBU25_02065 [Lentisphaeria bacterium]|jgi:hypothetical protein|nr:hypothetical protein [Lentisphaeria bacterium]
MPTVACPFCQRRFPSPAILSAHFRASPECWAFAVLSRSQARVGARLCPRCRRAISAGAPPRWSAVGFVHEACLTPDEFPVPIPAF